MQHQTTVIDRRGQPRTMAWVVTGVLLVFATPTEASHSTGLRDSVNPVCTDVGYWDNVYHTWTSCGYTCVRRTGHASPCDDCRVLTAAFGFNECSPDNDDIGCCTQAKAEQYTDSVACDYDKNFRTGNAAASTAHHINNRNPQVAVPGCAPMHRGCDDHLPWNTPGLYELEAPLASLVASWDPVIAAQQFTGYTSARVCGCSTPGYFVIDRGNSTLAPTCQLTSTLCPGPNEFIADIDGAPYYQCVDAVSCSDGQQSYREPGAQSNRVCGDTPLGYWNLVEFSSYGSETTFFTQTVTTGVVSSDSSENTLQQGADLTTTVARGFNVGVTAGVTVSGAAVSAKVEVSAGYDETNTVSRAVSESVAASTSSTLTQTNTSSFAFRITGMGAHWQWIVQFKDRSTNVSRFAKTYHLATTPNMYLRPRCLPLNFVDNLHPWLSECVDVLDALTGEVLGPGPVIALPTASPTATPTDLPTDSPTYAPTASPIVTSTGKGMSPRSAKTAKGM